MERAVRLADRRRYQQIIERYVLDCFANRTPARASELSDLLAASRGYVSRLIPKLFGGQSLQSVLWDLQITEAKRLLHLTPMTLDEVAAASGFGHRSTFHRRFRELVEMTPTDYRMRSQNATRKR